MFLNIWFSSSSTFSLILKPKPKLLCRFAMSSTTTLTTFRNTSPPFFLSKHKNHCSSLLLLSFVTWSSGSSSILVCISSSSKLVIHYLFLIWFYCSIILCSVILNMPLSLHFGCILFSSFVHFFVLLTGCLLPLPEVSWIALVEAIPLLVAESNSSWEIILLIVEMSVPLGSGSNPVRRSLKLLTDWESLVFSRYGFLQNS